MNLKIIENSLNKVNEIYSAYIQSTNYSVGPNLITWNSHVPGVANKLIYVKEYEELLNACQYSFLFVDDSFFQFYYEFEGDELKAAKLAYYPYPVEVREKIDDLEKYLEESGFDVFENFYLGILELKEAGIVLSKNSHIRFDYDRDVKTHSTSHVHYGSLNDLRIPMTPVLTPFTFCDFIFYCLQVDWYNDVSTKATYENCRRFMKSKSFLTKDEMRGVHMNL